MAASAREQLLDRLIDETAANGLADRSLRDLAESAGSSHRMVLYHFGSREGLVAAIVQRVEADQMALLEQLAAATDDPGELVLGLWAAVSAPEMMPFVRLFFECVAATGGRGLTEPWLELAGRLAGSMGIGTDSDELRLGVAVTRGLLIDVLASGDATGATRSLERFVAMWEHAKAAQ